MKRIVYFLFGLLLLVDTFNQVAFKLAGEKTAPVTFDLDWLSRVVNEPWTAVIVLGYLATFLLYMTLIRNVHVGPAFAASHLEIVTVLIFSVFYFGERLTPVQMAGCVAIMTGVAILAVTEKEEDSASEANAQ